MGWHCKYCDTTGSNTTPARLHISNCQPAQHSPVVLDVLSRYVPKKRKTKSQILEHKRNIQSSSNVNHERQPTNITVNHLRRSVGRFFLTSDLAFRVSQSPQLSEMLNNAIEFGRQSAAQDIENNFIFSLGAQATFEKHFISPVIEEENNKLLKKHIAAAQDSGATVVLDGRKNAAKKSNEGVMVETIEGAFLLCNRFPEPGLKKDMNWHYNLLLSVLFVNVVALFKPLTDCIFASVTDGAKASVQASQLLEKNKGVISVLCQLHALNRLIVHIFEKIPSLADVVKKANIIFAAFMAINRFREYMQSQTGKVMFRFVPTRMLYIPVVFGRLCSMKEKMKEVVHHVNFKNLLNAKNTTDDERKKINEAIAILDDNGFWELAYFSSAAFLPITLLARELDRGISNISVVYWGWRKLVSSFRF